MGVVESAAVWRRVMPCDTEASYKLVLGLSPIHGRGEFPYLQRRLNVVVTAFLYCSFALVSVLRTKAGRVFET